MRPLVIKTEDTDRLGILSLPVQKQGASFLGTEQKVVVGLLFVSFPSLSLRTKSNKGRGKGKTTTLESE